MTDTAGPAKAKVDDEVEIFSNMRTQESIRRSDLCLLLIDVTRAFEVQDFRIISDIRKAGGAPSSLLNKWDILGQERKDVLTS